MITTHAEGRLAERGILRSWVEQVVHRLQGRTDRTKPDCAWRLVTDEAIRRDPVLAAARGLTVITDEWERVVTVYWAPWEQGVGGKRRRA